MDSGHHERTSSKVDSQSNRGEHLRPSHAWATVLTWSSDRRLALALTAALAVLFAGLLFAFSQTSFFALFVGLAVLAALRWSVRWTAIAGPVALAAIVLAVVLIGSGSESRI